MNEGTISLKNKFFGDKAFYKMILAIAVPIIIQNLLTNLVSMADNIMVGQLGTDQMSGVAIINQLFFVFNLLVLVVCQVPVFFPHSILVRKTMTV